jgi:hypothetical protein
MLTRCFAWSLGIFALLNAVTSAMAADYQFSGRVNFVDTPLTTELHFLEVISGRMTLGPPTFPISGIASYPVSNFSANIGGDYTITSSGGDFTVFNDFAGSVGFDGIELELTGIVAPNVQGHSPNSLSFLISYFENNLTSTDLIPQFVLDPRLDRSYLQFDGSDSLEAKFTLTDLSRVPEPSTAALLVIGCVVALVVRRP